MQNLRTPQKRCAAWQKRNKTRLAAKLFRFPPQSERKFPSPLR
jgi:hypothetical protein